MKCEGKIRKTREEENGEEKKIQEDTRKDKKIQELYSAARM